MISYPVRTLYTYYLFLFVLLYNILFCTHAFSQEHPNLPLTGGWFHINGKDRDGYIIGRRYSLVLGKTDNNLRNTISFNCSPSKEKQSYVTFFIPKEINLKEIYGKEHFAEKKFKLYTLSHKGKTGEYIVSAEVIGNEIFLDFSNDQKDAVASILEASKIYLLLSGQKHPIEFFIPDDSVTLPFEGKEFKFNDFVRTMLDRDGSFSRQLDTDYFFRTCSDLSAWRIQ